MMIGRTVGNYRIIEQVGLGGMATIYKAYDPNMDRTVALKVLPQQFSNDPQFQARFQREAKAIANLEHLHILPIFAYGEDDGIAYMAMRYMPSGTLSDRIAQGALPLAEAARILTQLAGALDHAHAHGVLHRDLKPSNVLLDENGNAYLTDFGIAKIVEATLDLTGDRLLGTPAYMSPEQCRGEKALTPATDIYALGIVLYEMVTGKRPFHAETPVAVILQQLNDPLPPPHQLRPDLPPLAENVILKALSKAPTARYASAGEMGTAFAQAVVTADTLPSKTRPIITAAPPPAAEASAAGPIDTAPAATPPSPPVAARGKLPGWAWGMIGGVLLMVLVGGGLLLSTRPQSGAENPPAAAAVPTCAPNDVELLYVDFEDGDLSAWDLSNERGEPVRQGWQIVDDGGNKVLVGRGHGWAMPPHQPADNVVVHLRIRRHAPPDSGSYHINVAMNENGRLYFAPTTANMDGPNVGDLELAAYPDLDDGQWHTMTIAKMGNRVLLRRDEVKIADFTHPRLPRAGHFALENTAGEIFYDAIRICRVSR